MTRAAAPRVSLIAPLPPLRGGIAHHSDELFAALSRVGADVSAVSYARIYPRALFPGRSEHAPSRRSASRRVAHVLVPHHPTSWPHAERVLAAHTPDIIVAAYWHWWTAPALAALLARRRPSCAAVLIAHNTRSHDTRFVDEIAWRALRATIDRVVVASARDAAVLQNAGMRTRTRTQMQTQMQTQTQTQTLRHPPYHRFTRSALNITRDDARRRLGLRVDGPIALCFGLVRPYKGIDTAARAVARLASSHDLRLCIVGESYVRRDVVDSWVAPMPPGQLLRVDRYIDDDEVALWFRAADVVIASHRAGSESGPMQIARALGVPVIASDVGNFAASADEVCAPGDDVALADAIRRILDRGAHRQCPTLAHADGDSEWDAYARALLSVA